ncbi:MAG TPA: hypothetical protein VK579_07930 [Terriglobales bacterium]|nr:hypothetical protein [Terriglobales bacterium]
MSLPTVTVSVMQTARIPSNLLRQWRPLWSAAPTEQSFSRNFSSAGGDYGLRRCVDVFLRVAAGRLRSPETRPEAIREGQ